MRNIILNLAVSLDGLIEGPNGEFDWCFTDQDYGMTDFLRRVDTIFFGRKSYEMLRQFDPNAYPDHALYVFSNNPAYQPEGRGQRIEGDSVAAVRQLKAQPGRDIWLWGGASLTSLFLNADLVDELQLSVHPLLLGRGKLLFQDLKGRIPLQLVDTRTYASGLVQLFYRREG